MYNSHFGFSEAPFSISPDPRFLYLSERHREALAHLIYGAGENGGFVLLSGEVGTGKTMLIRTLLSQDFEDIDVALCLHSGLTVTDFIASVLDELHIPKPRDVRSLKPLIDALNAYLLHAHAKGRQTVIIIDEAQNLSREVLEQVRLLTNLETDRQKLLRIILVGQDELLDMVNRDDLRQLSQRITARYHLSALNEAETKDYIFHRIKVADGSPTIMSATTVKKIYRLTEGVPRLINVLCDRALLTAYNEESHIVTVKHIQSAAVEVLPALQQKRTVKNKGRPRWIWGASLATLLLVGFAGYYYKPLIEKQLIQKTNAFNKQHIKKVEDNSGMVSRETNINNAPENETSKIEPSTSITQNTDNNISEISESKINNATQSVESKIVESDKVENNNKMTSTTKAEIVIDNIKPNVEPNKQSDNKRSIILTSTDNTDSRSTTAEKSPIIEKVNEATAVEQPAQQVAQEKTMRKPLNGAKLRAGLSSEFTGIMALAEAWQLDKDMPANQTLCGYMGKQAMQCVDMEGGFPLLATINRPALLEIQADDGKTGWLPVLEMSQAEFKCIVDNAITTCPLGTIAQYWTGRIKLLLRKPNVSVQIRPQFEGEQVKWLRQRVAIFEGKDYEAINSSLVYDDKLVARVKNLQSKYGLVKDGIVGNNTLLHIFNVAVDDKTPLLKQN